LLRKEENIYNQKNLNIEIRNKILNLNVNLHEERKKIDKIQREIEKNKDYIEQMEINNKITNEIEKMKYDKKQKYDELKPKNKEKKHLYKRLGAIESKIKENKE